VKKKGTLRFVIIFLLMILAGKYIYNNNILQFDTIKPEIVYSGNKHIYNKQIDNLIYLKDLDNKLSDVKLYFSSIDSNSEWVRFYFKKISKYNSKNYSLNLKDTKLDSFFSSNIKKFNLKVELTDNSFKKNTTIKEFQFDIDNLGPEIIFIKKSMNIVKENSLMSFNVIIKDNVSKIKSVTINGNTNYITRKNDNTYAFVYFFKETDLKKKYITLKVSDEVSNTNSIKIYYIKGSKLYKEQNININNSIFTFLKNINTDLEDKNTLVHLEKKLTKELNNISDIIKNDNKNITKKYTYFDTLDFKMYFKTNDKILKSSFPSIFNFQQKKKIFTINSKSIFYKINRYKSIYPINEGEVIYISENNILNQYIIVKHLYGFYSVYFLIKPNKNIIVGQTVDNNTEIGKPVYNNLFKSNIGFKMFFKNNEINPNYFLNKRSNKIYIQDILI